MLGILNALAALMFHQPSWCRKDSGSIPGPTQRMFLLTHPLGRIHPSVNVKLSPPPHTPTCPPSSSLITRSAVPRSDVAFVLCY